MNIWLSAVRVVCGRPGSESVRAAVFARRAGLDRTLIPYSRFAPRISSPGPPRAAQKRFPVSHIVRTNKHGNIPQSPIPSGIPPGGDGSPGRNTQSGLLYRLVYRTVQAICLLLAFNVASDATGLSSVLLSWLRGPALNPDTFVPFTITAKEQVSPTAFVLTVRPGMHSGQPSPLTTFFRDTHADSLAALLDRSGRLPRLFYWPLFLRQTHPHGPALSRAWSHGLWSVEIRQPQLQVARDYTPLPPRHGRAGADADCDAGALRFLIRRLDNGEVSTYLSRLAVGDTVDIRGPHLGFDVRSRLGSAGSVVFLAGGTGVAPALQVIRTVLDDDQEGGIEKTAEESTPTLSDEKSSMGPAGPTASGGRAAGRTVSLIWANRHRADCAGLGQEMKMKHDVPNDSITAQLAEMQARHPEGLNIKCVVDEERSFISAADIQSATTGALGKVEKALPLEEACRRHAQKWVAVRPGRELEDEKCECEGADGQRGAGGKNLLFVSGPDGFIEAYAGRKRWAGGLELQGGVAGLIGNLKKRDLDFWRDWLVLKL